MTHTCDECHQEIPAGEAVVRTVNFERLAFHRECWAWRMIPAQRRPTDESLT